jgi:hypothetical protein
MFLGTADIGHPTTEGGVRRIYGGNIAMPLSLLERFQLSEPLFP